MGLKSHNGKILSKAGHLCSSCCGSSPPSGPIPVCSPSVASFNCRAENVPTGYVWHTYDVVMNSVTMTWWGGSGLGGPIYYTVPFDGPDAFISGAPGNYILRAGVGMSIQVLDARAYYEAPVDLGKLPSSITIPIYVPGAWIFSAPVILGGECTLTLSWTYPSSSSALGSSVGMFAMDRFEICKACSDQMQGGFACRIFEGCCLGQKRFDASFHCPANKW